jgi:hypothetical protein
MDPIVAFANFSMTGKLMIMQPAKKLVLTKAISIRHHFP